VGKADTQALERPYWKNIIVANRCGMGSLHDAVSGDVAPFANGHTTPLREPLENRGDQQMSSEIRVLFLCTGNSARSQMAEGWLRHLAGGRFVALSAGTHPVGLNPYAVKVMEEIGIDISGNRSKSVQEFTGQRFDYVITVCDRAKESCPIFPGASSVLHWSFEDPAARAGPDEDRKVIFRKVRDQISDRIKAFLSDKA
jgi:arsenate reductase